LEIFTLPWLRWGAQSSTPPLVCCSRRRYPKIVVFSLELRLILVCQRLPLTLALIINHHRTFRYKMSSKLSDLAECFRIETRFFPDHVGHTTYSSDPSARWRKMEEKWYVIKEIGRGGFATVRLEKELKGRLRAVKVINKRQLDPQIDYGRELQAMGILSKVSSSRALEDFSTLLTRTSYSIGCYS
jgi:hypothetical protein